MERKHVTTHRVN